MKVLSIDIGTTMGYSVFNGRGHVESGSVKLGAKSKQHKSYRFINFSRVFNELIDKHEPDVVVYERVRRHLGTAAAHVYGGFLAFIHFICLNRDIEFTFYEVRQIKKHATGSGRAKKPQMIKAAEKKWKYLDIEDDNHADALWIGHLYMHKQKGKKKKKK